VYILLTVVYDCTDLDQLVKEFENKMTRQKLDYSKVKRAEEIRNISNLKHSMDPVKLYTLKGDTIEKTMSPVNDLNIAKNVPLIPAIDYNRKLPQYQHDATITIIKDKKLQIKAGGYNETKVYEDLASYSKLGLYID
jgi:hypothetical protein